MWGALAMALLPGGVLAQGLEMTEDEFNGTQELATPLPLTTVTVTGKLNVNGDLDFFRTEFFAGNRLRVTAGPFIDEFLGRLQVLNSSGAVIGEVVRGSSSTVTLEVDLTAATPPGVGYIRFSNDVLIPGNPTEFDYILQVAQGVAEVEPNDTTDVAGVLGTSFPNLGTLWKDAPSDDLFTFQSTEEESTAIITLDYSLDQGLSLLVALFDADLNLLGFDFRNTFPGTIVRRTRRSCSPCPKWAPTSCSSPRSTHPAISRACWPTPCHSGSRPACTNTSRINRSSKPFRSPSPRMGPRSS